MEHLIVQILVETMHEKKVETGILETYLDSYADCQEEH